MASRSLKPQLNQIRTWVRQGRTDAWIAHQLEVTARDIRAFKREHELVPVEAPDGGGAAAGPAVEEEPDLRAEDDALVAAELEAELESEEPEDEGEKPARRRRRGRRGGRSRRTVEGKATTPLEGTFDHGEEGYGLWLDPAVQDDPIYAEHWAGHRPVTVALEPDRIVIRRAGGEADGGAAEAEAAPRGGSKSGADAVAETGADAVAEATADAGLDPTADAALDPDAAVDSDPALDAGGGLDPDTDAALESGSGLEPDERDA